MHTDPVPCLILACGNALRADDGIGPHLAQWAAEHWRGDPRIRVLSRLQWTPELAVDIAAAQTVLFLDSSVDAAPGSVALRPVQPAAPQSALATHHIGAPELLALARDLYNAAPQTALLLTVGAASLELRESLSAIAQAALPRATALLQSTVNNLFDASETSRMPQSA